MFFNLYWLEVHKGLQHHNQILWNSERQIARTLEMQWKLLSNLNLPTVHWVFGLGEQTLKHRVAQKLQKSSDQLLRTWSPRNRQQRAKCTNLLLKVDPNLKKCFEELIPLQSDVRLTMLDLTKRLGINLQKLDEAGHNLSEDNSLNQSF